MSQGLLPREIEAGRETTEAAPARFTTWAQRKMAEVLALADIRLEGKRPWDVRVLDDRLFRRVLLDGLTGLGDAYVDGWWECEAIDRFFTRVFSADLPARARMVDRLHLWELLKHRLFNLQSLHRAAKNLRDHYELGNDVFEATLDKRMAYTCGYWRNARTLDEAQEAKLDLACRKIGLKAGQRVLDAGCGWGAFLQFAAENYGARAVGVTLSAEPLRLAQQRCAHLPNVEIRLQDYRVVDERFDHIVCIGMMEHVGPRNYCTFMRTMHRCLSDDGMLLIQTIGSIRRSPNLRDKELAWLNRHIFSGGVTPSLGQITAASDGLFVVEDVHNFSADYDPTLMAWIANFDRNWPSLREKYGQRFSRMWKYYLLACAGAFRSRKYQLWQLVLSKKGVRGGYTAVR